LTLVDDKLGEIRLETTTIAPGGTVTAEVQYKTRSVGLLKNTAIIEGWYGEVKVTDEDSASVTVTSGGGSGGGDKEKDKDKDPKEEPIVVPEEPVVGEPPVLDQPEPQEQEQIEVPAEQAPVAPMQKELPKTGGNPASLILSGFGLTGLGILLRRRT
jgi:LPXTG-motif cell wall-anchored protein